MNEKRCVQTRNKKNEGKEKMEFQGASYLSWAAAPRPGSSTVAVLEGPAATEDEVAAATSGNCSLKLASNSSPGFCELVLQVHVFC